MEGKVIEGQFLRDLVELGQDGFTGAIRLELDDVIKIIYFQDGQVISASTNDPAESVDEILLRGKKVTREHIQQALVKRKQDETLGDALLSAGFITRKELRWARRHQIVEVLRSTLGSEEWHYTVVPDYVSSRSGEGTAFQVAPILIELIVTDPDRKRIDQRLDGGKVRLQKSSTFDERYAGLGLNEDADRIAERVDGEKTATEIAAEAGGNGFMNLKLLAALRLLGLLEDTPKVKDQLEISFDAEEDRGDLLPGIEPASESEVEIPAWEIESPPDAGIESPSDDADTGLDLDLGSPGPEEEWSSPEPETPFDEPVVPEPEPESEAEPFSMESPLDEPAIERLREDDSQEEESDVALGSIGEEEAEPDAVPEEEFPPLDLPEPDEQDLESEVGKALDWSPPPPEETPRTSTPSGLEVEEPVEERDEPVLTPRPSLAGGGSASSSQSLSKWIIAAVILVVIAGAAWFFLLREESPEPVAEVTEPAGQAVEPEPTKPEPVEESESEGRGEQASAPIQAAPTAATSAPASSQPQPAGTEQDPLRSRYDAQASQFVRDASSVPYAIQFAIVCQTTSVTNAIEEGGSQVWFIPIEFQGRPCYRVFWGRYQTEEAAAGATGEIPEGLRGSRPVVVQPGRLTQ